MFVGSGGAGPVEPEGWCPIGPVLNVVPMPDYPVTRTGLTPLDQTKTRSKWPPEQHHESVRDLVPAPRAVRPGACRERRRRRRCRPGGVRAPHWRGTSRCESVALHGRQPAGRRSPEGERAARAIRGRPAVGANGRCASICRRCAPPRRGRPVVACDRLAPDRPTRDRAAHGAPAHCAPARGAAASPAPRFRVRSRQYPGRLTAADDASARAGRRE